MSILRCWLVVALLACNLVSIPVSYAGLTTEFLAFPSVTMTERSKMPDMHGIDKEDFTPALDLFFTADYDNFRLLAEVYGDLNGKHGAHVERFQVGWLPNPELAMWFGRYHNPVGFWNSEYHHGSYLQTAISRPAILEFEDDGGILPTHLTGLLIEQTVNTAQSSWRYAFAIGAGPYFNQHLEAVDLFRSEDNSVKLVSSLRLSWHPSRSEDSQVGLFVSSATIPGEASTFEELKQFVGGVYTDWHFQSMRLTSALYSINSDIKKAGQDVDGSFINGYLQLEIPLGADWTPYGRFEKSQGAEGDPFLHYAHTFIRDRSLIGVRYDVTTNQSIKLELSDVDYAVSGFSQATFQWSAVFP